jgi:3-oxoadipate enol-lactonase
MGILKERDMKFQIDDGFLEYDRTGQGVPLLFIHGYPLSNKIWDRQKRELSGSAQVISLDLRGHGESYPFIGPYPMELLAEDCFRLLTEIDIKQPVVVCGLSMGGYVAFALYRTHPQLFRGLILISTRAGADSPEGKNNRDAGIRNVTEHGVAFIADGMQTKLVSPSTITSKPELVHSIRSVMLETSVNGIVGALQGMRDRIDSTPFLSQISCPTLIIHGADDQLIPVSEAEAMKAQIPDSRLVVIPGAGHLANMEQPDKFNQAVEDFIDSIPQD